MSDEMKLMESRILQSLNDVKKSQTTIIDSIQAVTERFDVLESRVADISTRQTEMDSKLRTLNQRVDDSKAQVAVDIEEQLRDLREEVQEERRKLIRLCNVVLFGVPETNEGLEVATKMISVLLPDWKGQIEDDRIGAPDAVKPRPLRVKLDNHHQKRKALSSKRKLKTFPEFKGISVQPDMTKTEQKNSKEKLAKFKSSQPVKNQSKRKASTQPTAAPSTSGVITRADRKRRCSAELTGIQTSKFGKSDEFIDVD
jgi:hypothetical protein